MSASTRANRWPDAWVALCQRRAGTLLALGSLLALAGALGSARLYSDLRPDLTELLPADARSARDADELARRVGGWAEETVALHGPDPLALQEFADQLAPRLTALPHLVHSVDYRLDGVRKFFRERRWLFPSPSDLVQLRDRLQARIRWEKQRANPLFVALDDEPAPDLEGLLVNLTRDQPGAELLDRFPTGYFAARTRDFHGAPTHALVLRVRLAGNPGEYQRVAELDRVIRATVAALLSARPSPTVSVSYGSYVASAIFEHNGLAEDLVVATLLVVLAVALAIAVYFGSTKAIVAVGAPATIGALVTFGIADLAIGHVNSNTAFLGSIVIGNGINPGIILFARYAEERRRGDATAAAMTTAVRATWRATLLASVAAGLAYSSLLATTFRGFRQFGFVGGVGMACCWLATYAFLPPLVLAWERRRALIAPAILPPRAAALRPLAELVNRAPRRILAVGLLLSLASVWLIGRFVRDPLEYDFGNLRDSRALLDGGPGFWEDAVFGSHLDPCVVLARNPTEARQVARAFVGQQRPSNTIGNVVSIDTFVPEDQEVKLAILHDIRASITPELLEALDPPDREHLQKAIPPADLRPFGAADLPLVLRQRLAERDGSVGAPVLVYPTPGMDLWNGHHALAVARDLRDAPMPTPDLPMASTFLVFADVLTGIARDGPRATVLSLLGVAGLVVAFSVGRRPRRAGWRDAGLTLGALAVGVVLFGGLAACGHIRLNMLNFIVLPITFGIGVDYAANIVQRRRVSGATVAECLVSTGGAVAMCSLTTVIGYSSLLVAHNRALQSFGVLANLGELACLAVALVLLPAAMRLGEARQSPPAP